MVKTIGIGKQDFASVIEDNCFFVDKTGFIKEWWDSKDEVTLITRPRRFGKTLNMSMLNCFFSNQYKDRRDLFDSLSIWEYEDYRKIQGTYPVIFMSLASVKADNLADAKIQINAQIEAVYKRHRYLLEGDTLTADEIADFEGTNTRMGDAESGLKLNILCEYFYRYWGKKTIIILDEYDTPMQEAYLHGYWNEFTAYIRSLFNATFKTNPYMERAIMTGITRVSKESIFSDLNNLNVITTTSSSYATSFGFTENAIWSLLLASGYLKVDSLEKRGITLEPWYHLSITNLETVSMFSNMFRGWFNASVSNYNGFIRALLRGNVKEMNIYMNEVALSTFSSFDSRNHPSGKSEPERFYHGFVLGLLVELRDKYEVQSNRESGYGRYDVMIIPRDKNSQAVIIEFKVIDPQEETSLDMTADSALKQIEEKNYDAKLLERGYKREAIQHYGFAFEGKKVLIKKAQI